MADRQASSHRAVSFPWIRCARIEIRCGKRRCRPPGWNARPGDTARSSCGNTERTPLDDTHRDVGRRRIAPSRCRSDGIRRATGTVGNPVPWLIPVRGPLPDIARHVVQTEAVGWKRAHFGGAGIIRFEIPDREFSLPDVGHRTAFGCQLVSPDVNRAVQPPSCRDLPLGLGGERLACPLRGRFEPMVNVPPGIRTICSSRAPVDIAVSMPTVARYR